MTKYEFYNKWLAVFAFGIPEAKIRKHVRSIGNYIWHVFSWELLSEDQYLVGEAAKRAYDEMEKQGSLYIDWFGEGCVKDMPRDLNTAKALDKYVEVYVVGKDFHWTYIKTHEDMCGPYFMKANNYVE